MNPPAAPFQLRQHRGLLAHLPVGELVTRVRSALDTEAFAMVSHTDTTVLTDPQLMVLAMPLLRVRLAGDRVDVSGQVSIAGHARRALVSAGLVEPGPADHLCLTDRSAIWDVLRTCEKLFSNDGVTDRFTVGFAGFLGYDIARCIEDLPLKHVRPSTQVDLDLALHSVRFDVGVDDQIVVTATHAAGVPSTSLQRVVGLVQSAAVDRPGQRSDDDSSSTVPVTYSVDQSRFERRVERAKEHILTGDIYQVQLGHDVEIAATTPPEEVFERMRGQGDCPYAFLFEAGGCSIVGASPEMFVRVRNNVIEMEPIAGTCRLDKVPERDTRACERLQRDPKERAEHIMLVDLARNDMGRCSEEGSVGVPTYMQLRRFARVAHLASTVTSRRASDADTWDVVQATFPAGTMTGAPKIRAMEIIEEMESTSRGVYSGAVLVAGLSGYLDSALCIRAVYRDTNSGTYRLRASAGVVADSDPQAEWNETLTKMRGALQFVTGQEVAV